MLFIILYRDIANADTRMKKDVIEKATTELTPLFQNNLDFLVRINYK